MQYKDIKGYEGLYQVSNTGKVKSLDRIDCAGKHQTGLILSPAKCKDGYSTVRLSKNGKMKTFRVHRLIAEAFIPNPEGKRCVNHKDGNKSNNHASNLEWCTHSENNIHAFSTGLHKAKKKLNDEDRLKIKSLKGVKSCMELAKEYNVSFQLICLIWKGKR